MFRLLFLVALLVLFFIEAGALAPHILWPATVPLAVRSPYLSAWQNTAAGLNVLADWPEVSQPNAAILGWMGMIKVDSVAYAWMAETGDTSSLTANLTTIQMTPTRTIYNVQAGPVDVTVTFLTPIESSDWVRQSIPFSYLAVNASSNDGKEHTVQLYSDITAEWVAGNRDATVEWSTTTSTTSVYHQISLQQPSPFTEVNNQAEDATACYAMASVSGLTYQTGSAAVRQQFVLQGILTNSQDTDFRAISDNWPVFAISVDLGSIQTMTSPVVWAVGVVRNPSIQYTTGTGETQRRNPYYATQYSSIGDIIDAFLGDYESAMTRSVELDNQLTAAASALSSNYSDLVTLAARQTFGAIDITVANGTDGNWNTSDVMIFMKNIGGTNGRVNPVEVLYAAFPMFLYFNASFGKALLAPLLEFQNSPLYTLPYAASDLGQSYPVASGDNTSSLEGVEQSGNMLIMALAHARASGDGSLISQHYDLFKNWTSYLIENSLTPTNQYSADGQSTTNMTNLAIKGIIGIKAMSEISRALGNPDDAEQFSTAASDYANKWQLLSLSSAQQGVLFTYGDEDTWTLVYNLYADCLLQTDVVDQSVYTAEEDYYMKLADGGFGNFGLPVDSASSGQVNSAWLAFTAASVSNTTVRDTLLDMIWTHSASNQTPGEFPTTYSASSGAAISGWASPAQGAMFAPLALSIANQTIKGPPTSPGTTVPGATGTGTSRHVNVGAIAGGVVGGIAALGLVFLAMFLFWRRKRQSAERTQRLDEDNMQAYRVEPAPFPYETSPSFSAQSIGTGSASMQQPLIMSSKVREYLRAQERAAPAPESREIMEPPSTRGSSSNTGSLSPNEIVGLRTEVENLRRVMQELHSERLQAPPEYEYEG